VQCAKPILERVLEGYNGCIFAYGQTGSGKTYTMEGEASTAKEPSRSPSPSRPNSASVSGGAALVEKGSGIIPRLCADLFTGLDGLEGCTTLSGQSATTSPTSRDAINGGTSHAYLITAQYIEIYQETLNDLLKDKGPSIASSFTGIEGGEDEDGPRIRQTPTGSIFVEGVVTRPVSSPADIARVLSEGQARRTRGETNMNSLSSRSHAVLTLAISVTRTDAVAEGRAKAVAEAVSSLEEGKDGGKPSEVVSLTRTAKLSLIDLAGSERAEATGATGARLKEGAQVRACALLPPPAHASTRAFTPPTPPPPHPPRSTSRSPALAASSTPSRPCPRARWRRRTR